METREKQAYLIEAHKCDEMLLTLLRIKLPLSGELSPQGD